MSVCRYCPDGLCFCRPVELLDAPPPLDPLDDEADYIPA